MLAALNEVAEPLERTILGKVKADAVKQEKERNEDIVRSALRSLDSLSRIRWVGGTAVVSKMSGVIMTFGASKRTSFQGAGRRHSCGSDLNLYARVVMQ